MTFAHPTLSSWHSSSYADYFHGVCVAHLLLQQRGHFWMRWSSILGVHSYPQRKHFTCCILLPPSSWLLLFICPLYSSNGSFRPNSSSNTICEYCLILPSCHAASSSIISEASPLLGGGTIQITRRSFQLVIIFVPLPLEQKRIH